MQPLEDRLDFSRRPIANVTHSLPTILEVTLLRRSHPFKPAPKLNQLLVTVVSDRYNPVISVENDSQSVDKAKVTAIGATGIGFNIVAVVGVGTCEFGEREIVFRDWRAQDL